MSYFLTKIKYLNGLQCPKRLWIEKHMPEKVASISLAQQRIIEQGSEVGEYARQCFPDGVLIGGENTREAVKQTQTIIEHGETCLFEAAFAYDDLLVRCDILQRNTSDAWDLIEVKSSTVVKDEHLHDLAFQKYVVTSQGLPVHRTHLMHINRACVAPDLSNLFVREDMTVEVDSLIADIPDRISYFRAFLARETEPDVFISKACAKPIPCPIKAYCWRNVPERSIFTIPYLRAPKPNDLAELGIFSLSDIPADYRLSDKQRAYVEAVLNNQPEIDVQGIRSLLSELTSPIHFLDFETINPAIPRFEGTRPYAQIPFQYSCHILQDDGTLLHREYLHTDTSDPRLPLLKSLLTHISETGSVVAYNAPFERGVLKSLAATFPEYATEIQSIISRLWDQLEIFKKHYLHPGFLGSNSIKNVLPILVPSLTYQELGVQKGDDAQAMWEKMIHTTDEHKKRQMIKDLTAYCKMDTLAMVEIHKVLREV